MTVDQWAATISAACAALSIVGAAFAWWRENLSKKAKVDAERAREDAVAARVRAEAMLVAVEKQADDVRRMADLLEGPPLVAEPLKGSMVRLRNTSRERLTVLEVVNAGDFPKLEGMVTPITLDPGQSHEFGSYGFWGYPAPLTMTLRLDGRPEVLHVPLPGQ